MFELKRIGIIIISIGITCFGFTQVYANSFTAFESGQVRPIAVSPNGKNLFIVNTPDNRVEIFRINNRKKVNKRPRLIHIASVPVGMEPVAVAAKSNKEIWVVNHLSDSISIVSLKGSSPKVVRTLLVGDEPRDIVFAGINRSRAFITTAHRGQNSPIDPQLTTPGVGRADVWVFETNNLEKSSLGGTPLTILTMFTDTPRALSVSPTGKTVYAAGFHTGNQTAVIDEGSVCNGGKNAPSCEYSDGSIAPGGLPGPNEDTNGNLQPEEGIIVKYNGQHWVDELNRSWDNKVMFSLPDKDVFKIDASAAIPRIVDSYQHVGTTLFNMIVNPVNGKVYVSNTEALNSVRFEGTRPEGSDISSVIGHQHESRITILSHNNVIPRHINKHIDYSVSPAPLSTKEKSLALPRGMAISKNGETLYLAAKGSSKIGVFKTKELENNTFTPNAQDHIKVSGGGPTGLALSKNGKFLFALTRFNNAVVVIDTKNKKEIESHPLFNPEPTSLIAGRPFLYDAVHTSSNGEATCGSCHVDGDLDHLAWDLGDPLGTSKPNLNIAHEDTNPLLDYHPLKGPMTTQSLRGLKGQGPLHWRGDRTAADIGGDPNDENGAFNAFNVAFVGLIGRESQLSDEDMQAFTDFSLQLTYPPNPIRALDNSLTTAQERGRDLYFNDPSGQNGRACNDCHRLSPENGMFGSGNEISNQNQTQQFKIPHFRNMYTKVGMFGRPITDFLIPGDGIFMGDQIRGFGFLHNGNIDTIFRFEIAFAEEQDRRSVEQFILAYDTNLAPIVGQQVTLTKRNKDTASARVNLMIERARLGECDLIVKGNIKSNQRGWYLRDDGLFVSDRSCESPKTTVEMNKLVFQKNNILTYTCAPPGSGIRMGIDRDLNGILDSDSDSEDVCNTNVGI